MRSDTNTLLRPRLARLALAGMVAAGVSLALAEPASAGGRGHGGHGFHHGHHGHFAGPSFRHHRHAHPRHYRSGTRFSFTFLAPPPVYAYRSYAPPVRYVAPAPAYATGCTQGAWRHPNGVIERGIACLGPDGYWRMTD